MYLPYFSHYEFGFSIAMFKKNQMVMMAILQDCGLPSGNQAWLVIRLHEIPLVIPIVPPGFGSPFWAIGYDKIKTIWYT